MRTITSCILILLFLLAITGPVLALTGPINYQGRTYYVVNANELTENTGIKVCEKAGKAYVGFTALTTDICTLVHPSAKVTSGMDGSRTGFYCNGAPQGGICAKQADTCNICPACNLNVDANTVIGDQYREMYVECQESVLNDLQPTTKPTIESVLDDLQPLNPTPTPTFYSLPIITLETPQIQPRGPNEPPSGLWGPPSTPPTPPAFTPTFFTSVYSGVRLTTLSLYWNIADKQAMSRYLGGKWGCDFYQYPLANQKSVDCTKSGDAESYCQNKLGSANARAEYCGSDGPGEGLIVCSESCTAGSAPATCPADPSRNTVRGTNAPVSSCSGTSGGTAGGVSDNMAGNLPGAAPTSGINLNQPTIQPSAAATSGINLNRPTLQPAATTAGSSGSTRTVSVQGATAIEQVTVTGQGLSDIVVTATELDSLPKGTAASPGSAPVYQYVDIIPERYTTISGSVIGFSVPSSWIASHQITSDKVVLGRLDNGAWTILPTTVDREENGRVYYKANSPSLSIYGVFGTSLPPLVCPSACSLGGNTNCVVTMPYGLMPYYSSEGPMSQYRCSGVQELNAQSLCSCDPVPLDTMACPGSCAAGSTVCTITTTQQGSSPCEGKILGDPSINIHCFCVYREGSWQLGSGWNVGLGHNFAND
jgi:PGF-pre-PGF domain-containing protein